MFIFISREQEEARNKQDLLQVKNNTAKRKQRMKACIQPYEKHTEHLLSSLLGVPKVQSSHHT